MRPGKVFDVEHEGVRVGVILTAHFTEQFHLPYKHRAAVEKTVPEDAVMEAIKKAIPMIVEYQSGDPDLQGIVIDRKNNLNMSFIVRPREAGFTLVMTNMMLKAGYETLGPRDYQIKVNPIFKISFERSIDHEIRVAVIEQLAEIGEELEGGGVYSLEGPLVTFGVERQGNTFEVDWAGWKADMLYVPVP